MTTTLPTKWDNPVAPTGFPCRFCKTTPLTTAPLKVIHEKRYHEKRYAEAEAAKEAAAAEESASAAKPADQGGPELTTQPPKLDVDAPEVHDLTRKFSQAMAGTDMLQAKKDGLVRAFNEQAFVFNADTVKLERFLTLSGMTASQASYVKLMLGIDEAPGQQAGNNTPQAMTFDSRTGQMVAAPIFMLPGAGGQQQTGQPMFFMPPAQNNDSEVARKLDLLIEKLSERAAPAPAPPQPSTSIRRYQRPAQTEGGDTVLVWVEEPVDPLNNTLAQLKDLGIIGRQETPAAPATPEAIGEAVAVKLEKLIPADNRESEDMKDLREEMRGSREDFKEYVHRSELKETERNAQEQAMATFELKMKPFIDDLQRELRENRSTTGLSDHQAELRHQGDLVSKAVNGLNSMVAGLRADLQPLAMSNMMGTMKTMGISDSQIADVIRHMQQTQSAASASPEQGDLVAESMSKWMN